MKRSVAAALGVVLVGGLGAGLYVASREAPAPTLPGSKAPSSAKTTSSSANAAPSTETPAHVDDTRGNATPPAPVNATGSAEPTSVTNDLAGSGEAPMRHGQGQIKLERAPTPAVDDTVTADERALKERAVQQKNLNQRFEVAACRAPGIEDRMKAMTDDERENLRARCARAGVRLP